MRFVRRWEAKKIVPSPGSRSGEASGCCQAGRGFRAGVAQVARAEGVALKAERPHRRQDAVGLFI